MVADLIVTRSRMPAPTADLTRPRSRPEGPIPSWRSLAQEEREVRSRRRLRSADLLVSVAWVSVAVSLGLFLASGGAATIRGLAGVVTAAGILAGLAATDLLLVMLVLAARVPLIDRTFGHDKALAAHRRIGKPALYLLLAHAVLLTLGYGLSDGANPIRETVSLITSSTDMLLAYAALFLLIAVVITSLVAVRRKLPYEVWHVVHLLSYAGVLVAVPHELSTGAVLAAGTPERTYWIALYVLAFGSILAYRFIAPLGTTFRHRIRVEGVERVAPDVYSISLTGRALDRFSAAGGQFAVWRFWTRHTWWHAHPISFSSAPTDSGLRLTVRVLGAGTRRLAFLPRGAFVSVEGPYGRFSDEARTAPFLAVIAAGIGVTPVRAMLEDSDLAPGEATVLLRAGDEDQRYLWDEVVGIVQRSGGTVYTMTGHRPRGVSTWQSAKAVQHRVSLNRVFPHLLESDVYICGPQVWTDLVVTDLRRAGVPNDRIHLERFDS
jgi:predicted ferric reductase